MKTTVTYGYVVGSLIIFSHVEPETKEEQKYQEHFTNYLNTLLKEKINGAEDKHDDDHTFLGINFDKGKEVRVNKIIERVTRTVCKEFGAKFYLEIKYVEEK